MIPGSNPGGPTTARPAAPDAVLCAERNSYYAPPQVSPQMTRKVDTYISVADKIVCELKRQGLEGEVYLEYTLLKYVEAQENRVRESGVQDELGLALRIVCDNRIGLVYTSNVDEVDIKTLVESCKKIAKLNSPAPRWVGFPSENPSRVDNIFSKSLLEVDIQDLSEELNYVLSRVKEDPRLYLYYALLSTSYEERVIMNTSGLNAQEQSTVSLFGIELVASEHGYSTPGVYEGDYSRTQRVSVDPVYERCREKTLSLLRPVRCEKTRIPVVFTERALSELLSYTLGDVLTARSFALRRSPFVGKLGEQVLSEKLTVVDDATLPGKYGSTSFDDEGVRTRRLVLIDHGVLRNIVTDLYWACFVDVKPTGHGFRASYSSVPGIAYTNIVIEPGDVSLSEIVEGEEEYLLVDDLQGAHSSNPESGEFSVAVPRAWIVKKGEKIPVKGVMLSGNIYLALRGNIELTREQFEFFGRIFPYIVFRESVNIIAR